MDTTIRNVDARLYREVKARAAIEGKTIAEVLGEAVAFYLRARPYAERRRSLAELTPVEYPAGSEHLSETVDDIVYR
jgi:hypothetical protein